MPKKRIISVLLGLILLAAASPCTAIAESENLVDIALEPPAITGVEGETIEVTIKAIPNSQKIAAMDVFLDFDATYLEVVDVQPDEPGIQIEPGTTLALPLATKIDNSSGGITYCAGLPFGMDSPNDAFTMASVTFRLKEDTAGTTEITFHTEAPRQTMVAYKGNPVLGSLTGTTVTVSADTAASPPVIEETESMPIAPAKLAAPQMSPTSPPAPTEVPKPVPEAPAGLAWWMIVIIIGLVAALLGFFTVKIRGWKLQ